MHSDVLSEVVGTVHGGAKGSVEVFDHFSKTLEGIERFEFLWLITGTGPKRLQFSLVRKTSRDGNTFHFSGRPIANGTAVLGIKPYRPKFDPNYMKSVWMNPCHIR